MQAEELVSHIVERAGLVPVGPVVSGRDSQSPIYYVTLRVARDASGKQVPSNRSLHAVANELKAQGITVEFILTYEESQDVERGLRATILHSHIDQIRNLFVSIQATRADVWIEPKGGIEADVLMAIHDRAEAFLRLVEIELSSVKLTTEEILPSKLALLTTIRHHAPASLTVIAADLGRRKLTVPSPDWLHRRLDALRRAGQVVRLGTGEYTLTEDSLKALGTAKNRTSPDIRRLLALSRRGS